VACLQDIKQGSYANEITLLRMIPLKKLMPYKFKSSDQLVEQL
jgi:hypothetical protein